MPKTSVDVAQQLKALTGMTAPALRAHWKETFGRPHPGWFQKDFLLRCLAYRLQEEAYGGLSAAIRKRLKRLAEGARNGTASTEFATPRLKPGTRLIRSWRGETHEVTVADQGFTYRGRHHASLSEIARAITGTRWSGPLFFGLKTNGAKNLERQHVR